MSRHVQNLRPFVFTYRTMFVMRCKDFFFFFSPRNKELVEENGIFIIYEQCIQARYVYNTRKPK